MFIFWFQIQSFYVFYSQFLICSRSCIDKNTKEFARSSERNSICELLLIGVISYVCNFGGKTSKNNSFYSNRQCNQVISMHKLQFDKELYAYYANV